MWIHAFQLLVGHSQNADCQGNVWQSPFKWLATYGLKGIKNYLPHLPQRREALFHPPTHCPLLPELGLKIIMCPPVKPSPASTSPVPTPRVASTAPTVNVATTDTAFLSGGTDAVPSGLVALVTPLVDMLPVFYDTDDDFCWDGDESGLAVGVSAKINKTIDAYLHPSCSHAQVLSTYPIASTLGSIHLPSNLQAILGRLSLHSHSPPTSGRLIVTNSGVMDHMIPDRSSFVSYRFASSRKLRQW